MNIPVKRQTIDEKIWFELLSFKDANGYPVFVDSPMLEAFQEIGHTILDMDVVEIERQRMARCN